MTTKPSYSSITGNNLGIELNEDIIDRITQSGFDDEI
jgi:hypothetical protein